MKLALCTQTPEVDPPSALSLLSGTFEQRLQKAAALGVQGVELAATNPATLDAASIRAALRANDLEVAAIGSVALGLGGTNLLHADPSVSTRARARMQDMIAFAADVGSPLVTIGSFRGRLSSVSGDARGQLISMLRDAVHMAEARGVRLALEPMNRFQTDIVTNAEEGLAFLDEVGHPSLGLLLDTCHMITDEASWSKPFQRVMASGRLWHVHLADSNRLAPGYGLIDFRPIISTLRQIGYTGYLSIEVLAKPDPDTAARDAVAHMLPLLQAE
jgi:sugar phosphate isomerase/epimerase